MARSRARNAMTGRTRACRRVLRKPLPSRFEGTPATGVRSSRVVADTKLTAVELQHGSEEGAVAKTDVAHPILARPTANAACSSGKSLCWPAMPLSAGNGRWATIDAFS